MQRLLVGLVVLLAGVGSCGETQVTMLGPRLPARPPVCGVEISSGTPAPPFVDLATARSKCIETARGDCLDDLRRQTCLYGGDTVYGLAESTSQHITHMTATLALRRSAGAGGAAPGAGAAGTCLPICSPGFDCQAGRCIPLCNPACAPSEVCNNHRTCEPAPPAGPPTQLRGPADVQYSPDGSDRQAR